MTGETETVIIGAGPAGCAAGVTLANAGRACVIVDNHEVPGGISRSVERKGAIFDVGPHRFFTKQEEILALWREMLGDELIHVDRLTRILYRHSLFNYPLSPINALLGLGIGRSFHAMASYLNTRMKRTLSPREPTSFEEWITDNFGPVLYETFFKVYTEKVWGIPCSEIGAEWASQRIKGLNLFQAVFNALTNHRHANIKTLVNHFFYPRRGAGLLYRRMTDHVVKNGGQYMPGATVAGVARDGKGWAVTCRQEDGSDNTIRCQHVLSSMPITGFVKVLGDEVPEAVHKASAQLVWRNHYCVNLLARSEENLFPDNWVYVHSPDLRMGRVANYANFSAELQPSSDLFPITVEVFSSTGDEIDRMSDKEKIELGKRELKKAGLMKDAHKVDDAFVVFSECAYPVIRKGYEEHVGALRSYIGGLPSLQMMGRAGLFQYSNQDHSAMTGILAARNVLGGDYDVWSVNIDAEYHESGTAPDLCVEDRKAMAES